MAGKNDKWLMFRNYMINELGITKEDIREWIADAVRIEAKKMVADTFARENPEQMIRRIFMIPIISRIKASIERSLRQQQSA